VPDQAAAAELDGVLVSSSASIFFGKLGKRNRRRIQLDPASKIFEPILFRHSAAPEGRG
jgi:hypothetical protein